MKIPLELRKQTGVDVGVNLALMQVAAHNSLTPELCAVDLLTSVACYGYDRYKDSDVKVLPEYFYIGVISAGALLYAKNGLIAEPIALVTVSTCYRNIKPYIGILKPVIIGGLWSYAITCLPHQYEFDKNLFGYYWCTYAGASNLLDIKDIESDRENGISTVPVVYGKRNTLLLSIALFVSALVTHGDSYNIVSPDALVDLSVVGFIGYSIFNLIKT